jgi:aryl-alcohol dehydrogenase-like predicted oxidoreductase
MPGLDEYRQPGTLIGRPRSVRPDQLAESRSPALPYRVQQLIFAHVQHFVYKPAYEVELRSEGVVRAISASMNKSAMLARFLRETAADVVISPVAIPFLNRMRLTTCLPAAAAEGKRVVSVGVFNSAFPPASTWPGCKVNYEGAPPELIDRAHRIADLCEEPGTSLPAAALAFPLAHLPW